MIPTGLKPVHTPPRPSPRFAGRVVKAGADAAGLEFGAEVIWKGPAKETEVAEQIAILEDYIVQRVDALVLAACDDISLRSNPRMPLLAELDALLRRAYDGPPR